MLQNMRDGASSVVIKVVLGVFLIGAVLGLVLMDIGGFFRGGVTSTTVAEINGQKLELRDFDTRLRSQAQALNLSLREAFTLGLPGLIVQEQADRIVLQKKLTDMGIRIKDEVAAEKIHRFLDTLMTAFKAENMDKKEVFNQFLRSTGQTEEQYLNEIKFQMAGDLFVDPLKKLTKTPSMLYEQLFIAENASRHADILVVKPSPDLPQPTQEELIAFYDAHKENYRTPEYRTLSFSKISATQVKQEINIASDILEEAYQERIDSFKTPETRKLTQVGFKDKESADKVLEEAKRVGGVKKALANKPKDFANLIDSVNYTKNELPEELADIAFNLKKGETSEPTETMLGWYVIIVDDVTPERVKPLKEVEKDLREELKSDRLHDALFNIANDFEDRIAGGSTLKEAAHEIGLPITQIENVDALGQPKAEKAKKFDESALSGASKVLSEAFLLGLNDVSTAIENKDGDIIFVSVDNIEESYVPLYEEVKNKIKRDWLLKRNSDATREQAVAILEKIANGENGAGFTSAGAFKKNDEGSTKFPATAIQALFQLAKIGDVTSIPYADDSQMIIALKNITYPDPKKSPKDMVELKGNTIGAYEKDMTETFRKNWEKDLKVVINHEVINSAYSDILTE